MIYLDSAATSFPKPKEVIEAVTNALRYDCVNAGRGGYAKSIKASEDIFSARENIADYFGLNKPENCIFTSNATYALNFAIKGLLSRGGHAVVSSFEHNAVMRPLEALKACGVTYDIFQPDIQNDGQTVRNMLSRVRRDTRCVICIYASNICGYAFPVAKIAEASHREGIPMICDASQAAGILPIDLKELGADFLGTAGHKSLYGPQGTGLLLVNSPLLLATLVEGGTGTLSRELAQPAEYPERLEPGTVNYPAIMGLNAGVSYLRRHHKEIRRTEIRLIKDIQDGLLDIPGVRMYYATELPVLSFNLAGLSPEDVGRALDRKGIAVRCGLHCAPLAHRSLGTLQTGTVRVSIGAFTSAEDVKVFLRAIRQIAAQNS